jgi:hypothetical protein
MNRVEAASPPPLPLDLRRATLRARRSGLKGRYRDRYATDLQPALDPGASTALTTQQHGQPQGSCPPGAPRRAQTPRSNPYNQVSTVSGDCQCHPRSRDRCRDVEAAT